MNMGASQRDYLRIEQSIAWMRAHYREQPRLSDMAAAAGLSESHYQRLFSRWAGISPKRFLQYLTLGYAQRIMRQSASLLDASLESGLSGPGRLHDLFVTFEAMSPGEFKRACKGLEIEYGEAETPFGRAAIGFTARGICHLSFLTPGRQADDVLRSTWPDALLLRRDDAAARLARRIFERADTSHPKPISAWVVGSNFQIQVWRALLKLPQGYLWSYAELAQRARHPGAARAVGTAMATNPVAYLIPCHRVFRQNGEVGQYGGGSDRKALLVGWEAVQRERAARSE